MPYTETVVLPYGLFTLELTGKHYKLNHGNLVIYEDGKRTVRGRTTAYAFRSVEQLRYDFERDVQGL